MKFDSDLSFNIANAALGVISAAASVGALWFSWHIYSDMKVGSRKRAHFAKEKILKIISSFHSEIRKRDGKTSYFLDNVGFEAKNKLVMWIDGNADLYSPITRDRLKEATTNYFNSLAVDWANPNHIDQTTSDFKQEVELAFKEDLED